MKNRAFDGSGWQFPPEFTTGGQEVHVVEGVNDIVNSLEILFGTILGERVMQEDFGASLTNYHFEPYSPALVARIKNLIQDAIINFEPRIELVEIEIEESKRLEGELLIKLQFDLPSSNSRYNMVYPFYLAEGNT
jgi:phage baseplate assembly protein W